MGWAFLLMRRSAPGDGGRGVCGVEGGKRNLVGAGAVARVELRDDGAGNVEAIAAVVGGIGRRDTERYGVTGRRAAATRSKWARLGHGW